MRLRWDGERGGEEGSEPGDRGPAGASSSEISSCGPRSGSMPSSDASADAYPSSDSEKTSSGEGDGWALRRREGMFGVCSVAVVKTTG